MTTLATRARTDAIPTGAWAPSHPSPRLAGIIATVLNPHPADAMRAPSVPLHIATEARSLLADYIRATKPAGRERLHYWLLALNAAVSNPRAIDGKAGETQFDHAVDAMVLGGCDQIAAIAMTSATQRQALQTFQFWPSVAEIHQFLSARAADWWRTRKALERIAEGRIDEPPPPPTDEDKARVRATVAAFEAEMQAKPHPGDDQPSIAVRAGFRVGAPMHPEHQARLREAIRR